ncbi:MAG TPA: sodium:solute symporter family protein [Pseudonocardia sp.]|uniref:sodium:solute symporter family protein n=1 Tax=Pseudonocardia sp. TaxID=60912 RepID=UPI002B4B8F8B|nr:sodium:solute symporter family protein [Pseudonocardia sp.]HLU56035.1 sodium:solute symporter family protein [Pseudonocardia sp.]
MRDPADFPSGENISKIAHAIDVEGSAVPAQDFVQFSTPVTLVLLAVFYGGTFLLTLLIGRRDENVDAYMVSTQRVGFGFSAASMTATWVWAASFYASAISGYQYGLSGPVHYGLWGALMILFIYPFGRRFRSLAPHAHTLGEIMHARHGSSSQLILAVSNLLGSGISLMVNFTAAGALVSVLSPLSFVHGVLIAGAGVLAYTLWSGFRASVYTDFAQVSAMMLVAAAVIPIILFQAGGPAALAARLPELTAEQLDPLSGTAFLEQGAPFLVAVLAYAIGNQTIAQRLFAVRPDRIKSTFVTATIGYGSIVIGLGMLGLMALLIGVQPVGGDPNNIVPQMASSYLPAVFVALFFILVIASLSSTADSDLSALSAIVMTDVYGKNLARGRANPRTMLLLGRITMIVATVIGVLFASLNLNILVMLVFVGALWGAIVFPVIVSCYWKRVTNAAFTWSVVCALAVFTVARFEWVPLTGITALGLETIAAVGGGVVLGLMAFGFFGARVGAGVGTVAALVLIPLCAGFLRDHVVLLSSLLAYGVSTIVCVAISLASRNEFDFALIGQRVRRFQEEQSTTGAAPGRTP